jgi:5-methylcytosine-specific restriction protein A
MLVRWNDANAYAMPAPHGRCKLFDGNGDLIPDGDVVSADLETGCVEVVQMGDGGPRVVGNAIATCGVFRQPPITIVWEDGKILTAGCAPPAAVFGKQRSFQWPEVRAAHLKDNPTCMACGGRANLEVHHQKPFHIFPDEELNPSNLVTLCATPGRSCHLVFGHLWDWRSYNVHVVTHARLMRQAKEDRPGQGKVMHYQGD